MRYIEKMKMAHFYVSKSNKNLRFYKNSDSEYVKDDELGLFEIIWSKNPFPSRFLYWAKENKGYKELLELADISKYSNTDIYAKMADKYYPAYTKHNFSCFSDSLLICCSISIAPLPLGEDILFDFFFIFIWKVYPHPLL